MGTWRQFGLKRTAVSPPTSRPVAVLPIDGARYGQLKALLEGSGVPVAEGLGPEIDVAVVDLGAPGVEQVRRVLADKAPRAAILGITTP